MFVSRRDASLIALAPIFMVLAATTARADDAAIADVSPVVVTAPKDDAYRAERTSTATRTDTPLIDVPQSVTVITDELIRDQGMRSLADVLRYVPGATMGQGEGHRDAPTLRGNSSTADFFVDGVRDDVQYYRDLYNLERVEVLKGPNAMIFGRGGGGGVINRVTKKAGFAEAYGFTLDAGSYDYLRSSVDANRVLTPDFAGRVVGAYEQSDSYRDFVNVQRWGVNPSLSWRGIEALTVQLAYEHFDDDRTVDRGVPAFQGRPLDIRRSAFFGDPSQSYSTLNLDVGTLAVEWRASDALLVRNRTLFGDYDKFYANIFPSAAMAAPGAPGTPATFNLQAYRNVTLRENLFNQTDLVWQGEAMRLRHTLLFGVEFGRQKTLNQRLTGRFGPAAGNTTSAALPISQPTQTGIPITYATRGGDAFNRTEATVVAAYVQDQIELTSQLQLLLGLRFESFDLDFRDLRTDPALNLQRRDFSRKDDLWSPRVGLVFKPAPRLSIYGSYSISHLPSSGDQFGSLNATSENTEPEEFENLEAGVKWEMTPDLFVSAALYRLERKNTTAPDPTGGGRLLQTGEQQTTGFEAEVSGRITDQWEIIGGYAWQDAEITSTTAAAPAGRKVPLVPKHTFSLWNKYEFTPRFSAGLGVIRQEKMFASISNAVTLPGFTRIDVALFVRLNDQWRAQVNVENLFDKRYFPTSHNDNNLMPGSPRALRVGLTANY